MPEALYLGIDVGINRGCAFSAIDENANMLDSGWFDLEPPKSLLSDLRNAVKAGKSVHVGIDAPRLALPNPREWFWEGAKKRWRARKKERGTGRHCEIAVKAHGLGNPQWSPLAEDEIPEWMACGFGIFAAIGKIRGVHTHEVFPTASYAQLEGHDQPRVELDFSKFRPGPKDLLDACVAATTVREFDRGRGCEVGGGDGLGTIVLPRQLAPVIPEVLEWPG